MNEKQTERLTQAYDRMMERTKHFMSVADEKLRPTLEEAVAQAREKAVELGEITREEAQTVGEYFQRDMRDLGEYLNETGAEMKTWLRIDLELIEARLLDLFASVADKTRIELAGLADRAREATFWHTGEVTGPGTLTCAACGERIHFHKTGHIPPCPKCHATRFKRVRG